MRDVTVLWFLAIALLCTAHVHAIELELQSVGETLHDTTHQASLGSPKPSPTAVHPSERRQLCHWPCSCPEWPPRCLPGVSLLQDGCGCCKACARQAGEVCTEADVCDYHKGLYCDYSRDRPRYEVGLCSYLSGLGCKLGGENFNNGQTFQRSCRFRCMCVAGTIGCIPLCIPTARPPRGWCLRPRRTRDPNRCCYHWVCDDRRVYRGTTARKYLALSENRREQHHEVIWRGDCLLQSTTWSPCSKTCGLGISTRIRSHVDKCHLASESRLCLVRPCHVDLSADIKVQGTCVQESRSIRPIRLLLSNCTTRTRFLFKFCGDCSPDGLCCGPQRAATISAEFHCPTGGSFTWPLMWINSCTCREDCTDAIGDFAGLRTQYDFNGRDN
uniref:CCN family member 4-like n=1 Tax=Myxine glutinosa TaxID=7769 RepID=UPI00359028C4